MNLICFSYVKFHRDIFRELNSLQENANFFLPKVGQTVILATNSGYPELDFVRFLN